MNTLDNNGDTVQSTKDDSEKINLGHAQVVWQLSRAVPQPDPRTLRPEFAKLIDRIWNLG